MGGADRVAARQLDHTEAHARVAGASVDRRLVEVLEGVFGPAHIANANQAPIGAFADHHILEFLHGLEVAVHQQREGGAVAGGRRGTADAAGDHHHVLRFDRLLHRVHAEVEAGQLEGIHPHPEGGITGAEHIHLAHPLGPGDRIDQVQLQQAVEIIAVELPLGGGEVIDEQIAAGRLLHRHPLGIHLWG